MLEDHPFLCSVFLIGPSYGFRILTPPPHENYLQMLLTGNILTTLVTELLCINPAFP